MSRRGAASASASTTPSVGQMGPPPHVRDREVVMGPPPVPQSALTPAAQKSKDAADDVAAKYSRLKRKYMELEDKLKDTQTELDRSGQRNVKIREERSVLLDRIIELETVHTAHHPVDPNGMQAPLLPRSLATNRAKTAFVSNLRQAADEVLRDDPDADPMYTSRHAGPHARKKQERERAAAPEDDPAREAATGKRAGARRTRTKGKEKEKDLGPPLAYTPLRGPPPPPSPAHSHGHSGHASPSQTLVSSTGTRLRIKPPAQPGADVGAPAPLPPHAHHQQQQLSPVMMHPQYAHHAMGPAPPHPHALAQGPLPPPPHGYSHYPGPPPPHMRSRSHSPSSPMHSPHDQRSPYGAGAGHYRRDSGGLDVPPGASPPHRASASTPRSAEVQRHAKPKRLKAHTVTSKSHSIPTIPRDKKGRPLLPLNVGIMQVHNLGEVCMREHFHTERYIFPVGYEVSRRYLSTVDPNAEVLYHCTILDGGDGPKFQIVATDVPDKPIIAGTATGAWAVVVRAANHVRNRQHSNSVSGPDFFGLGQNTIKHLIQELPGADQLKDYVWQNFVEGGPLGGRHAAVIPALPEDYDGLNAPPLYTGEPERELRDGPGGGGGGARWHHESGGGPPQQPLPPMALAPFPAAGAGAQLNIQQEYPGHATPHSGRGRTSSRRSSKASSSGGTERDRERDRDDEPMGDEREWSAHARRSPLLTREPRYEVAGATRSPTQGRYSPPPHAVPKMFAGIMNAYPPSASSAS